MVKPSVVATDRVTAALKPIGLGTQKCSGERTPFTSAPGEPVFDLVTGELLNSLITSKSAPVSAVPTILPTWNAACRDEGGGVGLARGWHVIIAALTGGGKSAFALNLIATALRAGERVCFLSLEMSQGQLLTRLLAILTGSNVRGFEHGSGFDEAAAREAAAEWSATLERTGGALYVNRRPLVSLDSVVQAIQAHHERHGCGVFVTDYVQLCWARSAASVFEQVQEISHTIRGLAADRGLVSIALSQFNRETSANRTSRPTPHGLMGGSALENDADQVVLLDHSSFKRTGMSATGMVLLAKNRHGPQVDIPVRWDYRTLQVREESSATDDSDVAAGAGMREGA